MSSKSLLDDDEAFIWIGDTVETIEKADGITFDRQTASNENGTVPLLVFVGEESYRDRMGDPKAAISIELMGKERWTIGFLDRTTDRYISLIDVETVDNFFEMVKDVERLQFGFSFPESPEAKQCPDCQGADHLNHVIEIDAERGEAFVREVEDIVGDEITV